MLPADTYVLFHTSIIIHPPYLPRGSRRCDRHAPTLSEILRPMGDPQLCRWCGECDPRVTRCKCARVCLSCCSFSVDVPLDCARARSTSSTGEGTSSTSGRTYRSQLTPSRPSCYSPMGKGSGDQKRFSLNLWRVEAWRAFSSCSLGKMREIFCSRSTRQVLNLFLRRDASPANFGEKSGESSLAFLCGVSLSHPAPLDCPPRVGASTVE